MNAAIIFIPMKPPQFDKGSRGYYDDIGGMEHFRPKGNAAISPGCRLLTIILFLLAAAAFIIILHV